jgi:hypothetical protein
MNKRIRELADQALDKVVPYTWTNLDYVEIQKLQEYFAELIVTECATWIVDNAGAMDHLGPEYFAQAMKNEFGVDK